MKLILANGTEMNILSCRGSIQYAQGANRDVLDIRLSPDDYTLDQADALFTAESCKTLKIREEVTYIQEVPDPENEGGTISQEVTDTNEYLHSGYCVRVSLSKELFRVLQEDGSDADEVQISVKMGQQTAAEKAVEALGEQITNTQLAISEVYETKPQMDAAVMLASRSIVTMNLSANETISMAPLYPEWKLGAYEVGDIRLALGQPWKCRQAHDTTTYPDITPEGEAWRTFWIPFHGTTPKTALPFVQPTMAEDQYKTGEMMIWTDGKVYRATMDTPYSPEEQGDAWEVVER